MVDSQESRALILGTAYEERSSGEVPPITHAGEYSGTDEVGSQAEQLQWEKGSVLTLFGCDQSVSSAVE